MIAFYKILTVPRKKQSASNELLLKQGPLWDRIFSKCYNAEGFFRPLPIRTYVSNKCLLHFSGFPHIPLTESQWRKLVPERRVTLPAEKDVDPEQKALANALTVSH